MLRDKRVQAAELREARQESFKCLEIREASGRVKETLAGTDGDGIVSHWIFYRLGRDSAHSHLSRHNVWPEWPVTLYYKHSASLHFCCNIAVRLHAY